jgi:hypothetical protein
MIMNAKCESLPVRNQSSWPLPPKARVMSVKTFIASMAPDVKTGFVFVPLYVLMSSSLFVVMMGSLMSMNAKWEVPPVDNVKILVSSFMANVMRLWALEVVIILHFIIFCRLGDELISNFGQFIDKIIETK